ERMDELEARAAHIGEEHAAIRVELAGLEERHRSESAALARVAAQWREITARRDEIGREIERLGVERARLLTDNIELDRKASSLAEQVVATEADVNRLAVAETELRESLAQAEEKLKILRTQVEAAYQRRSEIEVDLCASRPTCGSWMKPAARN